MLRKCFSLLLLGISTCLLAQDLYYPAGVESPLVWLKAEAVKSDDVNGSYQWNNYGLNGSPIVQSNGDAVPSVQREQINTYNFHPSIPYSSEDELEVKVKGSDFRQTTIIGVYGYRLPENCRNTMLFNVDGDEGFLATRTKLYHVDGSESTTFEYQGFISKGISNIKNPGEENTKRVKVVAYERATNPATSIWADNGTKVRLGSVTPNASQYRESRLRNPGHSDDSSQPVTSYMSELLAYGRALSTSERTKVETYLAFKYGLCISQYTTRWGEDLAIPGYPADNRAIGYGRDDKGSFMQQSSTTSYEENLYTWDDTYFKKDSKNKSTEHRLLVAGFSNKEDLQDSMLVTIYDNNLPTCPKEKLAKDAKEEEIKEFEESYHFMQRIWFTHTINVQEQEQTIELAYNSTKDSIFSNYVTSGEIYLVVNQNSESFKAEDQDSYIFYKMASHDAERHKVIFTGVKFNQEDQCFTFAFKGKATKLVQEESQEILPPVTTTQESDGMEEEPEDEVKDVITKSAISWLMYSDRDDKGFTIKVTLEDPEPVSFLVFDMKGRLVTESSEKVSQEVIEKHMNVPSKGVYVVKLITEKSRNVFAGKILVK